MHQFRFVIIIALFLLICNNFENSDAESVKSELIFTYTNPEVDNRMESTVVASENGNTAVVLTSGEIEV